MKSKTQKKKPIAKTNAENKKTVAKKTILIKKTTAPKASENTTSKKPEIQGHDAKCHDAKGCCATNMLFGLFSSSEWSDLALIILQVIIFGSLISLAFTYGDNNLGVIAIGAIVTAYASYRCSHKNKAEDDKGCTLGKKMLTSAIVGGFSTWIFMVIGSIIASDTGFIIGIIIGIIVALRVAPKACQRML